MTAPTFTYTATLPDGTVVTRKSPRTYSHLVALLGAAGSGLSYEGRWVVAGWCGRLDLAQKLASSEAQARPAVGYTMQGVRRNARVARVVRAGELLHTDVQVIAVEVAHSSTPRTPQTGARAWTGRKAPAARIFLSAVVELAERGAAAAPAVEADTTLADTTPVVVGHTTDAGIYCAECYATARAGAESHEELGWTGYVLRGDLFAEQRSCIACGALVVVEAVLSGRHADRHEDPGDERPPVQWTTPGGVRVTIRQDNTPPASWRLTYSRPGGRTVDRYFHREANARAYAADLDRILRLLA